MVIIEWLFRRRFNAWDLIWIFAAYIISHSTSFILGLIIFILSIIISVLVEVMLGKYEV
jgi:hypothetical protein